ncbi:hypothetical protein LINPERHAP1_LOCUS13147 [Linum perenne]
MVHEKLDKGLLNLVWQPQFPSTMVNHDYRIKLDHFPLFIEISDPTRSMLPKPFRFLAIWLSHKEFKNCLTGTWMHGDVLCFELVDLTANLRKWNRETFCHIMRRKEELLKAALWLEELF